MIGIPIGALIGVITGLTTLLLIRTALGDSAGWQTILSVLGELLALPMFWFGGPWLLTVLVSLIELDTMLPYYIVTLAIIYVMIVIVPIIRLAIDVGNEQGETDDD